MNTGKPLFAQFMDFLPVSGRGNRSFAPSRRMTAFFLRVSVRDGFLFHFHFKR